VSRVNCFSNPSDWTQALRRIPGISEEISLTLSRFDSLASTGELLWYVGSDDGRVQVDYGDQNKPFFIASATKLFVTAILSQLRAENAIDWDSPVSRYLPELDLSRLSVSDGRDFATEISIREVMAHTAGLPDYFEGKIPGSLTTFSKALRTDFSWKLDDVLSWSRQIKPVKRGKSLYSDTGYQLLGALIEQVDGVSFSDSVMKRVCEPLGLTSTYIFDESKIDSYSKIAQMLNGTSRLTIPRAMSSVQADGGIVSTVSESVRFLEAFFSGELFPQKTLEDIATDWHRIFPPLEYGTGIMRFSLPPWMTGFRKVPEFIGHSGASGTVMFRSQELGLTVVGTVNQVQRRSLPFQIMIRCALLLNRN